MAMAATALWIAPAGAQSQFGENLRTQVPDQNMLASYASCVVKAKRPLASRFVLDRTTLEFDRAYRALDDTNCMSGVSGADAQIGHAMSGELMRFALAEALLRDELASIDPAALPMAARLDIPQITAANYEPKAYRDYSLADMKGLDEKRRKHQLAVIMYKFGECAVRSNPQGARTLLQAPANSAVELQALQSALPAYGACLERGTRFQLSRAELRGALAFGYYSLAHAPTATP